MEWVFAILSVLMWITIGLLGLLVFLLNMPYRLAVQAMWDETHLDARGWVGWPLRLLGVMVTASLESQRLTLYFLGIRLKSWSFRELKEKSDREPKKQKKRKKKTKKNKKHQTQLVETFYMAQMPHKGHLLRQVARWLYLHVELQGRFGFDDPYDTGQLAMGLALLQLAFPTIGREVELDYLNPAFQGRMTASTTVWLPRIIVGMVAFLLSSEGREMIRYYRQRPQAADEPT